eukprot:1050899-Prorocentrum_minimum.AAC.1
MDDVRVQSVQSVSQSVSQSISQSVPRPRQVHRRKLLRDRLVLMDDVRVQSVQSVNQSVSTATAPSPSAAASPQSPPSDG